MRCAINARTIVDLYTDFHRDLFKVSPRSEPLPSRRAFQAALLYPSAPNSRCHVIGCDITFIVEGHSHHYVISPRSSGLEYGMNDAFFMRLEFNPFPHI